MVGAVPVQRLDHSGLSFLDQIFKLHSSALVSACPMGDQRLVALQKSLFSLPVSLLRLQCQLLLFAVL